MLDEEMNSDTTPESNGSEPPAQDPPPVSATAGSEAEPTEESPAPAKKAAAKKTTARKAPAKKAAAKKTTTRKTAGRKTAAAAEETPVDEAGTPGPEAGAEPTPEVEQVAPVKKTVAKRTRKAPAKKAAAEPAAEPAQAELPLAGDEIEAETQDESQDQAPATAVLFQPPVKTTTTRRTRKKVAPAEPEVAPVEDETTADEAAAESTAEQAVDQAAAPAKKPGKKKAASGKKSAEGDEKPAKAKGKSKKKDAEESVEDDEAQTDAEDAPDADPQADPAPEASNQDEATDEEASDEEAADGDSGEGQGPRRRRRRGGRRRRKSGDSTNADSGSDRSDSGEDADDADDDASGNEEGGNEGSSRRRRRRRRSGDSGGGNGDDPENTVTRVRKTRSAEDQITAVTGSTRLEAKKQRRREGREAGRRRAPIVSEAEFLARRESVDRVMVIRQREDITQIAVLEDKVLVEHYVARESQTSLIGNVYVGRVQNVLPSMEAAFVDIGKGRNAVIYAGEVNWAALGHKDGQPRKIESVLSSGQPILVQVTKDPIGHKGARLTGQISLPGRFLVYVPDGTTSGISRKLPDTERSRLKALLKEIVPDTAGVIVRTAAEGASEAELTQDVERLKARWEDIDSKAGSGNAPKLLYGEPDLTLKVVRDLFTEDFTKLVIEGDDAWDTVQGYVSHVAPDLERRLERYESENGRDSFAAYRIDEQIAKGLDRKVWLPSGGSLIIDRTEAMTVVDVNTGKFTGSGGNLEETVTKNNLEAAEEMVRQLRLRDIGGIIVVDFIDMVLESNRDLVLRRLVECLGRDRTRHQVAEVTSLGLVQMTRKRIGTGLLEAFSEDCTHCQGRGLTVHDMPIEAKGGGSDDRGGRSGRRNRGRGKGDGEGKQTPATPSPKDVAAVARPENADKAPLDEADQGADKDQSTPDQPAPEQSVNDESANGRPEKRQSGRGRGRGARAEKPQADQSETQQPEAAKPEAEQPEQVPEEVAEPAKGADEAPTAEPAASSPESSQPKVVTRTRRRASRPGGVTAAPAEAITIASSPVPEAAETTTEAEAPAPKVVTRTRGRRGASRSTGGSSAEATESTDSAEEAPVVDVHVPIKKKGSRKH